MAIILHVLIVLVLEKNLILVIILRETTEITS